jgi:hypothetical protein
LAVRQAHIAAPLHQPPTGAAAPHQRARDGSQTNSQILSGYRRIAALVPRLSKSADRALMAVCNANERNPKLDPLNVRERVGRELPQNRARQGNPHEAS